MRHSSSKRSARPVQTQVIQTLEMRRLMSLTAGFDDPSPGVQPGNAGDIQLNHAFDHAPHDFGGAGNGGGGFASFGQPFAGSAMFQGPNPDGQDVASSSAVVSATTTATADTAHMVTTTSATPTTLSALYGTLDNSTVAQIDSADSKSIASTIDAALNDDTHGTFTAGSVSSSVAASASGSQAIIKMIDTAGANRENLNLPLATSDAALARALSVVAPTVSMTTPMVVSASSYEPAPTWTSLRRLEDELVSVRAFANQVVAEIGRDSAIALSHLESLMDLNPTTAVGHGSLATWRSVAVAGAIVAGVAYAQSKSDGEKSKQGGLFSSNLIERFEFEI